MVFVPVSDVAAEAGVVEASVALGRSDSSPMFPNAVSASIEVVEAASEKTSQTSEQSAPPMLNGSSSPASLVVSGSQTSDPLADFLRDVDTPVREIRHCREEGFRESERKVDRTRVGDGAGNDAGGHCRHVCDDGGEGYVAGRGC